MEQQRLRAQRVLVRHVKLCVLSQLLQELCTVFNVDLPCRVKSSQLGIISNKQIRTSAIVTPQPSSCSYICQHCLVHLGDIGEKIHPCVLYRVSVMSECSQLI